MRGFLTRAQIEARMRRIDIGFYTTITLAVVIVLGWLLALGIKEHKAWTRFKTEHECKVVAKVEPVTTPIFNSDGPTSFQVQPGKTGWLCNDGVTYWR